MKATRKDFKTNKLEKNDEKNSCFCEEASKECQFKVIFFKEILTNRMMMNDVTNYAEKNSSCQSC